MKGYHHTYAIDAAQLIIECRQNLKSILVHSPRPADVNPNITDLDRTLLSTEQLVHYHLLMLIEVINDEKRLERNFDSAQNQSSSAPISLSRSTTTTLAESVENLKQLSRKNGPRKINRSQFIPHPQSSSTKCNGESSATVKGSTEKTATDSLLFRLVVILQLALVRIDEAKSIICRRSRVSILFGVSAVTTIASTRLMQTHERSAANNVCKGITLVGILSASRNGWRKLCMNTRLLNTSLILEDWQQQWTLIESVGLVKEGSEEQCKRLLKLMPFQTKSTSIWGSQESFRYNLIKYIMDCVYASFGTAHNVNKSNNKKDSILMPITAAVAASFYAVVGPGAKSAQVLSTSSDYSKMMQDSWGLISTPFCKSFSLHASRLLKGAAIAERIKIAGISCFILSKDPCPALSTAIRRYKRRKKRELDQELDTILEQCPYDDSIDCRAVNFSEYPKKDLIFHLTGGGFFAHTLAGDIPYLLGNLCIFLVHH
uniref:Uncharacterized protein n=1 Tax=Chaetoceros debilis TaxID=122233 RepID=A0A7S3V5U9_9STRA|mmetsp:Transcript_11670/g.17694  ORF Transcript_11670/g.17694 Transcript_11670/m.17694 type:complete len:487 (+) Transcript_11670:82-1542(+)